MSETEKITVNLSVVDVGKIDLLVQEGFYSSRTDLIRTGIRNLLNTHETAIEETIIRRTMAIGIVGYGKDELEKVVADGKQLDIRVIGMLMLSKNVTPDLATAAIHSIEVRGVFRASNALKQALADRMT
jgi:Arc/MetJ-type ribon-helix-helix transcriptional regulator